VGDAAFQKKCLGKMSDVAGEGRTVLFVSHNMAAIQALCPRSVWLHGGSVADQGQTDTIIRQYLDSNRSVSHHRDLSDRRYATAATPVVLQSVTLRNQAGFPQSQFDVNEPLVIEAQITATYPQRTVSLGVGIDSSLQGRIATVISRLQNIEFEVNDRARILCSLQSLPFSPGTYSIKLALAANGQDVDTVEHAIDFEVLPTDVYRTGKLPHGGVVILKPDWTILPCQVGEEQAALV
jgi:lipopolysaccharide transport system ATP-binding protein